MKNPQFQLAFRQVVDGTIETVKVPTDRLKGQGQRPYHPTALKSKSLDFKSETIADSVEWLKLATADDDRRPVLQSIFADKANKGTVAANGFILFHVNRFIKRLPKPDGKYPDWTRIFDDTVFDNPEASRGTISKFFLLSAIRTVEPFARESLNTVRFSFNGSLCVSASSAESGDASVSFANGDNIFVRQYSRPQTEAQYRRIAKSLAPDETFDGVTFVSKQCRYQHTGAQFESAADSRYLNLALSGLPDTLEFAQLNHASPLYLRGTVGDEIRTVIVMPMHVGN